MFQEKVFVTRKTKNRTLKRIMGFATPETPTPLPQASLTSSDLNQS